VIFVISDLRNELFTGCGRFLRRVRAETVLAVLISERLHIDANSMPPRNLFRQVPEFGAKRQQSTRVMASTYWACIPVSTIGFLEIPRVSHWQSGGITLGMKNFMNRPELELALGGRMFKENFYGFYGLFLIYFE
jgi:hypothetical protein